MIGNYLYYLLSLLPRVCGIGFVETAIYLKCGGISFVFG